MPRKAKDEEIIIKEQKVKTTIDIQKDSKKNAKTDSQKDTRKNTKMNPKKENVKKVAKTTKKVTSHSGATQKSTNPMVSNSQKNSKKKTSSKIKPVINEYYDLPSSYPETVVKILAQTPTILFVYWDISEKDKIKLKKHFGENVFENTTPFLVIKNETKNYQYEVEVNDYANSWYLHIPDSDCKYEVILIRKAKNNFSLQNSNINGNNDWNSNSAFPYFTSNYIAISSSNNLETPNDHILFERLGRNIFFQNIKTKEIQNKDISTFAYMHSIGNIYHIYDLYKEMYKDELNGDELGTSLSSSHMSF
jgi:hypothetical protein